MSLINPPPEPLPPVQPDIEDCCRSGCTPCVFDTYEEAMERYRKAHKRWRAIQGQAPEPDR